MPRCRDTANGEFIKAFSADVAAAVGTPDVPLGIFGRYQKLTLSFDSPIAGRRVYMQDLLCEAALDVTDKLELRECELTIPGALIDSVCDKNRALGDDSAPGVVMRLM